MNTRTHTYFMYVRKSSKGREKQILSIPSQIEVLKQLAKQQGLLVIECIKEKESAHVPGRPEFNRMMHRIEAGEANGILAWHPDRLARNSKDGGEIVYFLDTGKLT